MSIDVQIWSDIACPWCYIGKRRFERALEGFEHRDEVRVTWRSYQLDPTLPQHDPRSEVEYLVQAKGLPRATVEQMVAHVGEQARGEGLEYNFDALVVANSRRAHRVLQAAKAADAADGDTRTGTLKEALLAAHFVDGEDIGDVEVLTRLAAQAGIDQAETRAAVDSATLDDAVERDIREAGEIGVRGVPFFVFAGKYGVSGAQPPEVFSQALETVWSERGQGLVTLEGADGESCGPEGCD
ncbi:DsbA family oxidoreductase [Tessaracoccus flavus]|uniref:DsbA family oxidoreductase n=1 Tax=Tessaracoccus flavus TaxID=1610493 RepID=UPI001C40959C|nr:DsbA family oxidoreductase [Tessaracoccus flavus]